MNEHTEDTPPLMVETASQRVREQHARPVVADIREIEERMRQAEPARHPILAEREASHGDFADTARTAQSLKYVMHAGKNWSDLTMVQQEALDKIASKIARILSGDPKHKDHWLDVEGYARLVSEKLD